MAVPEKHPTRKYTYADYLELPDEPRIEILDGTLYNMTPAPSPRHQDVLGQLYRQFSDYLDGKSYRVYMAPFDVRLLSDDKPDDEVYNVVQPDLSVICAPDKIDDRGCNGSPDLIVEVLSPATAKKDKGEKLRLYRAAQVKEYWIVDALHETVDVYRFEQSQFPTVYAKVDSVPVGILQELSIDLHHVFR